MYTESAARFSQQFTDKIITRLLGQEYVLPFEIVHVSRNFLIELASHIEPQRPLCRLEKKINCDSTVAILLEDLTESNSIPTLTFELKVSQQKNNIKVTWSFIYIAKMGI